MHTSLLLHSMIYFPNQYLVYQMLQWLRRYKLPSNERNLENLLYDQDVLTMLYLPFFFYDVGCQWGDGLCLAYS